MACVAQYEVGWASSVDRFTVSFSYVLVFLFQGMLQARRELKTAFVLRGGAR